MTNEEKSNVNLRNHAFPYGHLAVAFLLPLIVLLVCAKMLDLFPFGTYALQSDLLSVNYISVLTEYRAKLLSGDSLFFSWHIGGGMNFWAMIAECLGSPLTLLALFSPEKYLLECVAAIFALKIAFASLNFFLLLYKKEGMASPLSVAISVSYALCAYAFSVYEIPAYLDALALLPIIILGLWQLIAKSKPLLFILTFAMLLISAPNVGFIVGLFVALFFPILWIEAKQKEMNAHKLWLTIRNTAGSFIVSLGLSAIVWLPLLYTSNKTGTILETLAFPRDAAMEYKALDFISRFFFGTNVSFASDTFALPNVYCGLFILLMIPLYATCVHFRFSERIYSCILLLILFITTSLRAGNFVWLGFRFPEEMAYPQAFVIVFLVTYLCARRINVGHLFEKKSHLVTVAWVLMAIAAILNAVDHEVEKPVYALLGIAAFLVFYAVFASKTENVDSRFTCAPTVLLSAIIIGEACLAPILFVMTKQYETEDLFNDRVYAHENTLVNTLENREEEKDTRTSFSYDATNEGLLTGISCLEADSDITPIQYSQTLSYLGFCLAEPGRITTEGMTPVMKALFGIADSVNKYSNDSTAWMSNMLLSTNREKISDVIDANAVETGNLLNLPTYEVISEDVEPLALGFYTPLYTADESVIISDSPFVNQNTLLSRLGAENAFETFRPFLAFSYNVDYNEEDDYYTISENGIRTEILIQFTQSDPANEGTAIDVGETESENSTPSEADLSEHYYFYCTSNQAMKIAVEYANEMGAVESQEWHQNAEGTIIDCGPRVLETGQTLQVRLSFEAPTVENFSVYAAKSTADAMTGLDNLRANEFNITKQTGARLEGTIEAPADGYLFLTTAYDSSWYATVDGQKVTPVAAYKAFLAIPVTAGTHEIVIRYVPEGLPLAVALEAVSVLVIIFIFFAPYYRKKHPDAVFDAESATTEEITEGESTIS